MESLLLVDVVSIEGVLALPASKLDLVVRHSVVQLTIEYHLVLKMDLFSIFLIKYKAEKKIVISGKFMVNHTLFAPSCRSWWYKRYSRA